MTNAWARDSDKKAMITKILLRKEGGKNTRRTTKSSRTTHESRLHARQEWNWCRIRNWRGNQPFSTDEWNKRRGIYPLKGASYPRSSSPRPWYRFSQTCQSLSRNLASWQLWICLFGVRSSRRHSWSWERLCLVWKSWGHWNKQRRQRTGGLGSRRGRACMSRIGPLSNKRS